MYKRIIISADWTEFRFRGSNLPIVMALQQGTHQGFLSVTSGKLRATSVLYHWRRWATSEEDFQGLIWRKGWALVVAKPRTPYKQFMMLGNAIQLHAGLSAHAYQQVHHRYRGKTRSNSGRDLRAACQQPCYQSSEWQTSLQNKVLQNDVPVCTLHAAGSN